MACRHIQFRNIQSQKLSQNYYWHSTLIASDLRFTSFWLVGSFYPQMIMNRFYERTSVEAFLIKLVALIKLKSCDTNETIKICQRLTWKEVWSQLLDSLATESHMHDMEMSFTAEFYWKIYSFIFHKFSSACYYLYSNRLY